MNTQTHTHFADILSLVVGNETILYTIQTCTSSRLGAVLPVFHYLCLSPAEVSLKEIRADVKKPSGVESVHLLAVRWPAG